MPKKGTYVCSSCGSELFAAEDSFDSKTGWPSFRQANANNVEVKQGAGEQPVRCRKCKRSLGVLEAEKKFFRADFAALRFVPPEVLELDIEKGDEKDEKKKEGEESASISIAVGGGVVGLILGAIGGFLFCQNVAFPLSASNAATSTALGTSTGLVRPTPSSTPTPKSLPNGTVPAVSTGTTSAGLR